MLPDSRNDPGRAHPALNIRLLAMRREARRDLIEEVRALPPHLIADLGGMDAAIRLAEEVPFRMTVVGPIMDATTDGGYRLWIAIADAQQAQYRGNQGH